MTEFQSTLSVGRGTKNEKELIRMIRESEDPEGALVIAVEIISRCLAQL